MPEPAPRNKLELIDLGEWAASSDPSSSRRSTKGNLARVRTHWPSQKITVAAMQIALKKVWAQRS
jgi:hypothetical protein